MRGAGRRGPSPNLGGTYFEPGRGKANAFVSPFLPQSPGAIRVDQERTGYTIRLPFHPLHESGPDTPRLIPPRHSDPFGRSLSLANALIRASMAALWLFARTLR